MTHEECRAAILKREAEQVEFAPAGQAYKPLGEMTPRSRSGGGKFVSASDYDALRQKLIDASADLVTYRALFEDCLSLDIPRIGAALGKMREILGQPPEQQVHS